MIDNMNLPVPLPNNRTEVVEYSTNAQAALLTLANAEKVDSASNAFRTLNLAKIVSKQYAPLRKLENEVGRAAITDFIAKRLDFAIDSIAGIDESKKPDARQVFELASSCMDSFALHLSEWDILHFSRTFASGRITACGDEYKYPQLYGRIGQREIIDALSIYTQAKGAAIREYKAQLDHIATQYADNLTKLTQDQRRKVDAWAREHKQYFLCSKIKMYEDYLSGEMQRRHEEEMANLPESTDAREGIGTRLKNSLGFAE